ncbi:MAG: 2-succinyl-6-hydroxy-2,4-cyclohexadiene-1-carboxylate synthase [Pseudanabaena frigida]|uniref:Putative 2-succinyl-6-hydroxy-2,4-cyclohexadiene-1-carboxylate synthase n=1 Tax=Pseudanabaena frigida TaxID=945775 RepID=A0A2W4WFL7_9CYAN|nr:MAG: 2-succinyl-6-hydroxy-2,4-cyclohexadiene-1-carboxylate synthase [Pseudanabaena frigida]
MDNGRFTYCSEGDSSHPAVLFLHGFMGNVDEFKETIASLSKQFYCVSIDLPAHGQTDIANSDVNREQYYTIQSSANFVIKFLGFLRIEECYLVGYSMGGRLALYLTINFPQYFHKVVLESASAGLRTSIERSDRLVKDRKLASDLETNDFRLFLENWYQQAIFANLRSHPKFPQMLEQRLNNSPALLAKSLRYFSIGNQPSLWEHLSKNEVPLLLLVGELDDKFIQINQQMSQLCKFSQLEIIPNCGHNIHFEHPEIFVRQIQAFFASSSFEKV